MKHTDIRELFANPAEYVGKSVTVCGWVRTARDSKTVAFIEINDGTRLGNLQLIIDKEKDFDLKDPESKTKFHKEIAKKLCGFELEVERENYLEAVADKLIYALLAAILSFLLAQAGIIA